MGDFEQSWYRRRTSRWQDWPARDLIELKQRQGTRISVVIPARNEERTVAGVVGALSRTLVSQTPLVDELVVMDSDSTDATARVAAEAGATVYAAREVAPALGSYPGKGEALWKSLLVTKGDLLVFVDADLTRWGPHFVTGLIGPLLADQQVRLVKGFYARVRTESDGSTSTEGGRVTELVARPLLSLWWPELSGVVQPLAGEWAARRSLMESLSIPVGYGVELATLMDTVSRHGLDALAQVDLGTRAHRHQANHDLALMAAELLVVAERRRPGPRLPAEAVLRQFVRDEAGGVSPRLRPVPTHERPPAASVAEQARRRPVSEQGVLRLGGHEFGPRQLLIMAIVNRTPDSFYKPGITWDETAAMDRVHQVMAEGADIIDVGGVPAAPGSEVDASEEIRRTAGFIAAVRDAYPDVVISVDTWRHEVGRAACAAGADLINDSWGGLDTRLAEVAAEAGTGVVCSHAGPQTPRTRPFRVAYADVMADVLDRTLALAARAERAGVDPARIVIDPAHDFGKNTWHSLEVTRRLADMTATGWPVLVSLSNKDFVGETLGVPPEERLPGTLASTSVSAWLGARIFRVHQVLETRQVLDMVSSIRGDRPPARAVRGLA